MPIPELDDGVLPDGIHDCTLDDLDAAFGHTPHRARLTAKLREFARDALSSGQVVALIVDGSFVTSKPVPGDIDLIVVRPVDVPPWQHLEPFEYNPTRKAWIRWAYGFDAVSLVVGSPAYDEWIEFYSDVRAKDTTWRTSRTTKGLLRVTL